jgi:hypothetical protein
MVFWSALRRWGERAVAAGVLTIADIRDGDPAACTLLLAAGSHAPVGKASSQHPSPEAPRPQSDYPQQLVLEQLMAQAIAMRRR